MFRRLTNRSLFSGYGGIDLAAEWAGIETVSFCEVDEHCRRILAMRWPGVPIAEDIHDIRYTDSTTIVSGGYPCQGESTAGQLRGEDDDRWLWPEMLRIVAETRPTWVLGENVANHANMGLSRVLADLEAEGFEAWSIAMPAAGVGAWHNRERVFVIAHASEVRCSCPESTWEGIRRQFQARYEADAGIATPADTDPQGCQDIQGGGETSSLARRREPCRREWWESEPGMVRVVHGIPDRLERSRQKRRVERLGNSCSPRQVYPILKAIAEIESV